ncbi:HNH endonuclease signature motif containing protein [Winogradskya consettensis]|nr:HNH endonuclease signature motif containing protein [Actinoplanes consettensis]
MARAKKVCSTSGCPALVDTGRCDSCNGKAEAKRGSAAQRGYDARWRRTRAAHLGRHPLCPCGSIATDVDHIDGLGPKGPRGHDPSNLRSLCHSCHSQRTGRDQPGGWAAR